ncbi:TRAP transporter small permease subunit [Pseudorhodoferax sp. Leaf267]|uniref:TRAP transporter small permease subunit n=1 Tax=Pseudorhodoferax sp. Leaf267 TaxID=1736316 RepID=UPI0006FD0BB7|nr:TRAP transporter small permease [Pseudorhodoferax sp. Leaf267]KQP17851.1 C4-dicarboxylate ABC transporter permease [Pseudorhodoferax sp. Leaf267]
MRRLLDGLFEWTGRLAALCVLAIFVLMIFASVGRMAGWRVGWVNDVVAWSCAAAAFLAMGHAFKHGDFVRVTLLLDHVDAGVRRALEVVSLLIATVAVGYLAWWAARFTYESFTFNDMAGGMVVIPIWVPQMTFVVGAIVLLLAVLDELVIVLRGEKPTYVRLVEERHARGDYSEDI